MLNYRKKRREAGISVYTMSKELGVDYDKYKEVERKKRPLEKEYLDKFLNTIENATEIRIKHIEKMAKVKEEIENGTLRQLVDDMGYSCTEVANALGITPTNISYAFQWGHANASEETRERLYDFLHNPFNKKIIEEKPVEIKRTTNSSTKHLKSISNRPEVNEWFDTHDLDVELTKKGIRTTQLAEMVGVTPEHISNVKNGRRRASAKLKNAIYDILVDNEDKEVVVENPNILDINIVDKNIFDSEPEKTTEENEKDVNTENEIADTLSALFEENARLRRQIDAFTKLIERL